MTIAFISGHLDITSEEFTEHYSPKIQAHYLVGGAFVVGDARGADVLAQRHLDELGSRSVTVFHMFTAPRNNVGSWSTRGYFSNDTERDAAMTNASDCDIAWVRPGRSSSGTAKNLKRRLRLTNKI